MSVTSPVFVLMSGKEKMNLPEIEHLVAEAINNRPKVTNAPLNLYIYDGRLICGARILMPKGADFVAHVPPYQLQNGFSNKEWKLIVEEIKEIAGAEELTAETTKRPASAGQNEPQHKTETEQEEFKERRSEQRLDYHRPMWFGDDFNEILSRGRMVDVSSEGMAFTCGTDESCLRPGQQIAARFSVPRLNPDDSFDAVSFNRRCRICRVNKANRFMRRVAVQFAKPLPFKPAEQEPPKKRPLSPLGESHDAGESNAKQNLKTVTT